MKVGRQVERWQSPDGKHVLRLFSRGPGCFYFVELSALTEKGEPFWAPPNFRRGSLAQGRARRRPAAATMAERGYRKAALGASKSVEIPEFLQQTDDIFKIKDFRP